MPSMPPSPIRTRAPALAFALGLALAIGAPAAGLAPVARGQDESGQGAGTELVMGVRPLFEGWYDPGRWVPLTVDLENPGADLEIEIQGATGSGRTTYHMPVELPHGARKRVPLLIQHNGARRVGVAAMLGRTELAESSSTLKMTDGEPLIVVVGDDSTPPPGVDKLGRSGRPIVVTADADGLPEHVLGWGSVDYVVLAGDALSRASEAQREALAQWVALGGELIVTGGPGAAAALAALPDALRPATVQGSREAEVFGGLEALGGGQPIAGSAPIALLDAAPGAVPIAPDADGSPLLVQRRYGDGAVVALAFDPSLPPFADWAGLEKLWQALHVQRGETVWTAPTGDIAQLGSGLYQLPEFDLPSLRWLLALIAVYILLVGPVNYLVLRRRRRLDLAWVTIPALTLIFSAASYGAGFVLHGRDLVLYELSAVRVIPDAGIAYVRTYVGLFSPGARSYSVSLPGALVQSAGDNQPIEAIQGLESGVRDLAVEQWALGSFVAEAVIDWPGAAPGHLARDDAWARGRLANPFGRPVDEAAVFTRGGVAPIGHWDDGGTHDASLKLDHDGSVALTFNPATTDDALRHVQSGILSTAFGYVNSPGRYGSYSYNTYPQEPWVSVRDTALRDAAVVYGWSADPPLAAELPGRSPVRRRHTLVHARVPMVPGNREAPPDNVVYATATERSTPSRDLCGPGGALFENDGPSTLDAAEFRFDLDLGTEPGTPLWVDLNGPSDEVLAAQPVVGEVKVKLRSCDGGDWIELGDNAAFGVDDQVPLPPEIQAAALARKAICLRLEPSYGQQHYFSASPQACWYPWLVLDAAPGPTPASGASPGGGG